MSQLLTTEEGEGEAPSLPGKLIIPRARKMRTPIIPITAMVSRPDSSDFICPILYILCQIM